MTAKFINKRKERYYIKSVNKRNRRWYLSTVQSVEMERSFYCLPSHDVTLFCLYMWYFCPTRLFNFTVVLTLPKTTNQVRISFTGLLSISVLHLQWLWRVLSTRLSPFFWGCLLCLILWNSTHQELHKYANCRTL